MDEVIRNTKRSNTEKSKRDKEDKEKWCQKDPRVISESGSLTSDLCERAKTKSGSYRD